ncbi:hypothetical protein PGT21_029946 [Puccinia graminis f. sp. tritici]|uniref:Uncharacterized protein n=1 Tax=Puccinia graminis f. sp. tritici TaxID=56615 RepID=A0A5B0PC50_PUCGR|nr:hypothetical protein PGT21_029946 [Puccinia graminis f. sp. tritici]
MIYRSASPLFLCQSYVKLSLSTKTPIFIKEISRVEAHGTKLLAKPKPDHILIPDYTHYPIKNSE